MNKLKFNLFFSNQKKIAVHTEKKLGHAIAKQIYYLITRDIRAVDTDVENIIAGQIAVHVETVLSTYQGLFQTFAPGFNLSKFKCRYNSQYTYKQYKRQRYLRQIHK